MISQQGVEDALANNRFAQLDADVSTRANDTTTKPSMELGSNPKNDLDLQLIGQLITPPSHDNSRSVDYAPIRLTDAIGKRHNLPYQKCRTWQVGIGSYDKQLLLLLIHFFLVTGNDSINR